MIICLFAWEGCITVRSTGYCQPSSNFKQNGRSICFLCPKTPDLQPSLITKLELAPSLQHLLDTTYYSIVEELLNFICDPITIQAVYKIAHY